MPCSGSSTGAGWNWLGLAQGSPGHSLPEPCLQDPEQLCVSLTGTACCSSCRHTSSLTLIFLSLYFLQTEHSQLSWPPLFQHMLQALNPSLWPFTGHPTVGPYLYCSREPKIQSNISWEPSRRQPSHYFHVLATLSLQPTKLLATLAAEVYWWLMLSLVSTNTPQSFSDKLLFSHSVPSPCWRHGVITPQMQYWNWSWWNSCWPISPDCSSVSGWQHSHQIFDFSFI